MATVGIRELQQNASAVVAEAVAGETVMITDRGRPVAQLSPLPETRLASLVASGRALWPVARCEICPNRSPGWHCRPCSARCVTTNVTEDQAMLWYVDTSAVVKLIVAEPESLALREWLLAPGREVVACDLVHTELFQVVRRAAPELLPQN